MLRNTHVTSSVSIKRSLLLQMGCFDASKELVSVEDYDLWLRIVKRNNIKHLFDVYGSYRSHKEGVSKKIDNHVLSVKSVLDKNFESMGAINFILFYPFIMSSYYSMVAYRRFIYDGIPQYGVIINSSLKSIVYNPIQIKAYYCICMSTIGKIRSIF